MATATEVEVAGSVVAKILQSVAPHANFDHLAPSQRNALTTLAAEVAGALRPLMSQVEHRVSQVLAKAAPPKDGSDEIIIDPN